MKAVIFDLDGVMVDSEPMHYHAFAETLRGEGVDGVTFAYYKQFVGSTNRYMWETAMRDFHLTKSMAYLIKKDEGNRDALLRQEGHIPLPGVCELVRDLYRHDIKLAVASSSPQAYIEEAVMSLHVMDCFSHLVTGESLERSKPAPDIFLKAAQLLRVAPMDCIVVEDSENGVRAANAAGMFCIAFRNPNSGNQDLSFADVIVDSFIGLNYDALAILKEERK